MKGKNWIIILVIILFSSYQIYNGLLDLSNSQHVWDANSTKIMNERCLEDSKDKAILYPEITLKFCECSTRLIQNEFTIDEYTRILGEEISVQKTKLLPVFQKCLMEYESDLKEAKNR